MKQILEWLIGSSSDKITSQMLEQAIKAQEDLDREEREEQHCLKIYDELNKQNGHHSTHRSDNMLEAIELTKAMRKGLK